MAMEHAPGHLLVHDLVTSAVKNYEFIPTIDLPVLSGMLSDPSNVSAAPNRLAAWLSAAGGPHRRCRHATIVRSN